MEIEKLIIFDGELSQTFQRLLPNILISRIYLVLPGKMKYNANFSMVSSLSVPYLIGGQVGRL